MNFVMHILQNIIRDSRVDREDSQSIEMTHEIIKMNHPTSDQNTSV